jgi:FkbM family methyltransferase
VSTAVAAAGSPVDGSDAGAAERSEGVIDVYGSRLRLDPDDSLFLGSHDYEPYASKLVMGLLRPTDVAVDVGAMIGYYTVILAKHVGPDGRVYAFEPDPDNFALLGSNIAMNGYDNVTFRQAIVGAEAGTAKLWRAPSNRGDHHAFPTEGRDAVDVDVVALDDVVDGPVDLVKIDVQGYESFVLAGMRGLIERSPELAMLVEFCPALLIEAGTQPADLLDELRSFGFSMYEIDDEARCVRGVDMPELLDRVRPEFGDAAEGYTNLLLARGVRVAPPAMKVQP